MPVRLPLRDLNGISLCLAKDSATCTPGLNTQDGEASEELPADGATAAAAQPVPLPLPAPPAGSPPSPGGLSDPSDLPSLASPAWGPRHRDPDGCLSLSPCATSSVASSFGVPHLVRHHTARRPSSTPRGLARTFSDPGLATPGRSTYTAASRRRTPRSAASASTATRRLTDMAAAVLGPSDLSLEQAAALQSYLPDQADCWGFGSPPRLDGYSSEEAVPEATPSMRSGDGVDARSPPDSP
eukprot:EG_transcript_27126